MLINFGPVLKQLREERELSLRNVFEATGITDSRLSKVENGTQELKCDELFSLLKLYNKNIVDFLHQVEIIKDQDIAQSIFLDKALEFKKSKDNNLTFIDLFAGVGGIHRGFSHFAKCVMASEIDKAACITYKANYPQTPIIGDITKQENKDKIPQDFDILCGGFPCQAFSIAGYQKGFDDERGNLFFDIIDIVKARKPRAIFLENVKNLLAHDKGNTFKVIKNLLEKEGYYVYYKVLNSFEYGNILQNRERIYIVAFDKDKVPNYDKFAFPESIKLTSKDINDYLESNVDKCFYYTSQSMIYDRIKDEITDPNTFYQWRRKYVRANKKGVCPTLTANMGTGGHNVPLIKVKDGIRKLTPRECFNLQGFPKDFVLPTMANSKLYKQAGNSVTVSVIERIAREVVKVLNS